MAVENAGKSIKVLAEERAVLVQKAQAYHDEHEKNWTPENEATFGEFMADAASKKSAINRRQQLAAMGDDKFEDLESPSSGKASNRKPLLVRNGRDANGKPRYVETDAGHRGTAEYSNAFGSYLQTGRASKPLQEAIEGSDGVSRYANLQSDNATQAGYLVASEEFAAGILKEVDDLLFIRQRAKVHTVREASSLGIRKRTTRLSSFAWGSELGAPTADTVLAYGKKVLTPHYMTGSIKLSRDLLRRSVVSAEGEVSFEFARNCGELQEDAFLTGTGNQRPLGVFTPSTDGISTARDVQTGSTTNFTADGLLAARYALKAQYRKGSKGAVSWLFHRNGIEKIAKLKDSNNQYLLRVGMGMQKDANNPEDFLLDYPVDESERSPNTYTTGLYVGLLANWQYYEIADALDMEMQVLYELNARTNEVEYIGRMKTDGMPTLEEAFVRLITN